MSAEGSSRRARLLRARLYLILTPETLGPTWLDRLARALSSDAVDAVQLRMPGAGDEAVRDAGAHVRALCALHGALFLVNDRPDLAALLDADGAHVGQDDLPVREARRVLSADRLLGLSTHDEEEVRGARGLDVDYLGLGPCHATGSKALARRPGGAALLERCLPLAGALPVFPIGGITTDTASALVRAGAERLAVGAGVLGAEDPEAAARALRRLWEGASVRPRQAGAR